MANRERGEVAIALRGEVEISGTASREVTLVMRTAEVIELETAFDQRFDLMAKALERGAVGFRELGTYMRIGLQRVHGKLTPETIAAVIDEAGPARCFAAIGQAIELAFPDLVQVGQSAASGGKAPAGTGAPSGETPSPPG
jgi:hypothetical protein